MAERDLDSIGREIAEQLELEPSNQQDSSNEDTIEPTEL